MGKTRNTYRIFTVKSVGKGNLKEQVRDGRSGLALRRVFGDAL
jgi:hypothetical protein